MPLTTEQRLFLEQVLALGDRKLAYQRQRIEEPMFIEWMQQTEFKTQLEKYEKYYIDSLTARIGQAGLKKLEYAIDNGIKTTLTTVENYYDPETESMVRGETRVITKHEEIPLKAVKMAIDLYIMTKVEKDVMNNIAELASRGLLPDNSEGLIASHMAEYQQRVKDALRGDFEAAGIDETILAQIQQLVVNGN